MHHLPCLPFVASPLPLWKLARLFNGVAPHHSSSFTCSTLSKKKYSKQVGLHFPECQDYTACFPGLSTFGNPITTYNT
ncbi:hypothetical protein FRX31_004147 [Thalictrum thalictroides]|uniref:Uncharacterized protein n=1 Tax=Thalictrum thalictroides TaxID=46969 RepID=A0A7J6XBP8_THATH|nr:hypothetical protein FRX31_004147 [Thalictrum thalictroides]